jgi:hypothetical protein
MFRNHWCWINKPIGECPKTSNVIAACHAVAAAAAAAADADADADNIKTTSEMDQQNNE